MAKTQTRRAVSLNREMYIAASKLAFRRGVTLSQLTCDALRAYGVEVTQTHHQPLELAVHNAQARRVSGPEVGAARDPRLVRSYVKRPGPIRKALGDAHADACGEPRWDQPVESRAS